MQNRSRDFHLPPKKRRRLCRLQAANNLNHKSPRHARDDLFFLLRSSPSWHYDSRALSGAPIVPLPRNRLALSATGGASPLSTCVRKNTSQPVSVEFSRQGGQIMRAAGCIPQNKRNRPIGTVPFILRYFIRRWGTSSSGRRRPPEPSPCCPRSRGRPYP